MREKTISRPVENDEVNPLRVEKESKLIVDFAVPCIISMLVTSLYNIVDQIFIGQGVGMLGNAATNIAFPPSIACTAISLLLGIGAASNFSLHLGAGEEKKAVEYAGTGLCLMTICGIALFLVTTLFLTPMLKFFGATPDVLPYAEEYTRITAIGFPFLIANQLRKNNGTIPGIRPGKPTSDFITKTLSKITLIGAIFLAIVAGLPIILGNITGTSIQLGGTSLLIVVGVALETGRSLEGYMTARHHKGFLE